MHTTSSIILNHKFSRNFLVTNKRYHTNMTSIVLCQSGLYSSAVLLASARGAHLDAYCGLVGVSNQEFGKFISQLKWNRFTDLPEFLPGWFTELNKILDNLSEQMFVECIVYLKDISMDYFNVIQNKITKIDMDVLKVCRMFCFCEFRLPKDCNEFMFQKIKTQLNPFGPVFRPIVARFISNLEQTETIENQVSLT